MRASALGAATVGLCILYLLWLPLGARAAEQHLFDPTLSLTGSCSTDAQDSVPDPWCPGPPEPSAPFESPTVSIDSFGDIYVGNNDADGPGGRIDVFSPTGQLITEISVDGPRSLAVDADGVLYVAQWNSGGIRQVSRFTPTIYKPADEEIVYGNPGVVILKTEPPGLCPSQYLSSTTGLAVDPTTGRLFVSPGNCVGEYGSAAEGNKLLDGSIGTGVLTSWSTYIAVDAARNRIYVADAKETATKGTIEVFELAAPHAYLGMLNGAATPVGTFLSGTGTLSVDVNEENGHLFVNDIKGNARVYEMGPGLGAEEEYFGTYEHEFKFVDGTDPGEIAVDNSAGPNRGTFYVPSATAESPLKHVYAFKALEVGPPIVDSVLVAEVTESGAVLRATINPEGDITHYRLEYTPQSTFEAQGFADAVVAGEGTIEAGIEPKEVSAAAAGLAAGTRYRFRAIAENASGDGSREGGFRTHALPGDPGDCGNDVFRTGFSAYLPDCRAYELVTPVDTNGRSPLGSNEFGGGLYFSTLLASPDGSRATFRTEGGILPGSEGSGAYNGDNYLARRGADGWVTESAGPSGTDAIAPQPGAASPDQEYSFWEGELPTLNLNPHIRYPDGHSEPVGRGSLGTSTNVIARLISQYGSHVIFSTVSQGEFSAMQLEPNAPPTGTFAVYDRTSDGKTHVVSLLPGDLTPAAEQNAIFTGASYDGEDVAFKIDQTLYLRHHNQTTFEVGTEVTFAGIAEEGGRVFYLQGGNIFALDPATGLRIQFSKGGEATPVNVSADGSTAYFISPDVLSGKKENPQGAVAQLGGENLYLSQAGQISFVGIVDPLDVKEPVGTNAPFVGLGEWVDSVNDPRPGIATSRTTPDGAVLLFESRAPLTGYDSGGHTEIYRYDLHGPSLKCLSCSPTEAPAEGDATLQTILNRHGAPLVLGTTARMLNLRPGGDRAFFQSYGALVAADVDGRQDVYEWEAQGVGSCDQPDGCVYLISSGQSARDDHLFAVSESGDDVFFRSADLLLGLDRDETPSIYDARVGGGFSEPAAQPCQGEACRGALTPSPTLSQPVTGAFVSGGQHRPHHCPKGKRRVRRQGKTRCVKKHRHQHRQHQNDRKASR
jgi:hypothetical protein